MEPEEDAAEELVSAVRVGDEARVRTALARGGRPDVTVPTKNGVSWCLVSLAASRGHCHLLPCLLEAGLSLEGGGTNDRTPLMDVASHGHPGTIKALLRLRADPLATDKIGWTALHWAAQEGHQHCVATLTPITPQTYVHPSGVTPVHVASYNGHKNMVEVLAGVGWPLTAKDSSNQTPLHFAARGGSVEVTEYLVQQNVDPRQEDRNGSTALDVAVESGKHAVAEWLTRHGGTKGVTKELVSAVQEGHETKVRTALAKGGRLDVTVPIKDGVSGCLITLAASRGHSHLLPFLLEAGLSFDGGGITDRTPLMLAAFNGHLETIRALLSFGAGPLVTDSTGWTALHYAAQEGHQHCVVALTPVIPPHTYLHPLGVTPVHVASCHGHKKVVKVLADAGWPLTARDSNGRTHLHWAACGGSVHVAEYLVRHDVDPRQEDNDGWTPLDVAKKYGQHEVEEWLAENGGAEYMDEAHLLRLVRLWQDWDGDRHSNIVSWMTADKETLAGIPEYIDGHLLDAAGLTPLHVAAERGLPSHRVAALLDSGVSPHVVTPDNITPADLARRGGHLQVLEALKQHHCEEDNSSSEQLHEKLLTEISKGDKVLQISRYLCKGAPKEPLGVHCPTALQVAVITDRVRTVRLLLASGASLSAGLLQKAWQTRDVSPRVLATLTTRLFKKERAKLEDLERGQKATIEKAAARKALEVQQELFHGSVKALSKNVLPADARTALLLASRKGFLQLTYLLLSMDRLPVDEVLDNTCGTTALHQAASHGRDGCVALLLEAKADPLRRDTYGQTPRLLAAMFGHTSTCDLLAQHELQDPSCRAGTTAAQVTQNFDAYLQMYEKYDHKLLKPMDRHYPTRVTRKLLESISLQELKQKAQHVAIDFSRGEAREVKEAVMAELNTIMDRVSAINPTYQGALRLVGSSRDGSKLYAPDEYDVNIVIQKHDVRVEVSERKETEASMKGRLELSVVTDNPRLQGSKLKQNLYEAVRLCLSHHQLQDKRLSIVPPGLTSTQVGVGLALAWQGREYPLLLVGVDLVPVLEVPWHEQITRPPLTPDGTTTMQISNADDGSWRCSFAETETKVLEMLGPTERLPQLMGKVVLSCLKAEPWMPRQKKSFCTWFDMREWKIVVPNGFCFKNAFLQCQEKRMKEQRLQKEERKQAVEQQQEEEVAGGKEDPAKWLVTVFRHMCADPEAKREDLETKRSSAYFGGDCEGPKTGEGAPLIVERLEKDLEDG